MSASTAEATKAEIILEPFGIKLLSPINLYYDLNGIPLDIYREDQYPDKKNIKNYEVNPPLKNNHFNQYVITTECEYNYVTAVTARSGMIEINGTQIFNDIAEQLIDKYSNSKNTSIDEYFPDNLIRSVSIKLEDYLIWLSGNVMSDNLEEVYSISIEYRSNIHIDGCLTDKEGL